MVADTLVVLRVERVEERAEHQVGGPDHRRRCDEEAARDTADRETDKLRGHDNHPLVRKVVRLVVEHALHGDDVGRVRRAGTNASHDGDEHLRKIDTLGSAEFYVGEEVTNVLLDGEGTRVEGDAEDLDVREELGPETPHGEHEQLGHEAGDGDRGIPEEEELVDALEVSKKGVNQKRPGAMQGGWSHGNDDSPGNKSD